jgi:hypothetical protein
MTDELHETVTNTNDDSSDGSSHFHDESGGQKYDVHNNVKDWPETVTDVPGIGRVKQGN